MSLLQGAVGDPTRDKALEVCKWCRHTGVADSGRDIRHEGSARMRQKRRKLGGEGKRDEGTARISRSVRSSSHNKAAVKEDGKVYEFVVGSCERRKEGKKDAQLEKPRLKGQCHLRFAQVGCPGPGFSQGPAGIPSEAHAKPKLYLDMHHTVTLRLYSKNKPNQCSEDGRTTSWFYTTGGNSHSKHLYVWTQQWL